MSDPLRPYPIAPQPEALPPSPRPAKGQRDLGLDLLRGLALVRVIVWHATSAVAVTLLAAMPVMFFVSGELFGRSATRHGAGRTVQDRLRRLGPPLWAFAAVAWVVLAVGAHLSGTPWPWTRALWWFLPVTDPAGTAWEQGWLATPLWYLRTLLWIFLLTPLIVRAVRRRPGLLLGAGAAIVVLAEWVQRGQLVVVEAAPRLVWQLTDVVLYGTFFAAGLVVAERGAPTPRRALLLAAGAAVVAAATWVLLPPPGGVVNDSHLTHLLVGTVVLGLAVAARQPLERLAARPLVRPVVHLLGRRSLTIYLWHTTAIVVALFVVERLALDHPVARGAAYATLIAAGTALLAAATGWVEDLAARRRPELWPTLAPRPTSGAREGGAPTPVRHPAPLRWAVPAVALALVAVALPLAASRAPSSSAGYALRVPSQAPPPPTFSTGGLVVAAMPVPAAIDPERLDEVLATWSAEKGITGAVIGVASPTGDRWTGAAGTDVDGSPRDVTETIDIASVTKLFTANLVYQAIDAGLIGLDDPLPPLEALGDMPLVGRVTVRQLLSHRTGLMNYLETDGYLADPAAIGDPAAAIAVSLPDDGQAIGAGVPHYSSSNYLVLGYLLEHLTGVAFNDLLRASLLDPAGLVRTVHLPSEPGQPRFATAGIVTDVEELARAGQALLVDHVGITEEAWRAMSNVDPEAGMGAGTMHFCPCALDEEVGATAFALGYASGHTLLVHLTPVDAVVALDLSDPFYGDEGRFDDVDDLLARLTDALAASADGTG